MISIAKVGFYGRFGFKLIEKIITLLKNNFQCFIFIAGNFDDFDSILVEIKNLVKMTGVLGRTQQKRLVMISGNRNGLIGMATIQAGFGGGMASKRIKKKL